MNEVCVILVGQYNNGQISGVKKQYLFLPHTLTYVGRLDSWNAHVKLDGLTVRMSTFSETKIQDLASLLSSTLCS